jgi:hypothetical protein
LKIKYDMDVGTALGIFSNIEDDRHSDKEKAIAIYLIMSRKSSINEVLKADMMNVIRWMWNKLFRIKKD